MKDRERVGVTVGPSSLDHPAVAHVAADVGERPFENSAGLGQEAATDTAGAFELSGDTERETHRLGWLVRDVRLQSCHATRFSSSLAALTQPSSSSCLPPEPRILTPNRTSY